jgi:hypothetical protein
MDQNWGTDQIFSAPSAYNDTGNIFVTDEKVKKELSWPPRKQKHIIPQYLPVENFEHIRYPNIDNMLTENGVLMILLVILIIMCAMVYTTLKQTNDALIAITMMLNQRR